MAVQNKANAMTANIGISEKLLVVLGRLKNVNGIKRIDAAIY
ncbi:hypothetical protein ABID96_003567 [Bacillus sp. OAE603]